MNPARRFPKTFLLLLFLLTGTALWAGPPFQTDDPEPVDVGHFEFYQFSSLSSTPVETDPTGPAFEFNWGAVPNLQLHIIVPFGAVIPSNNPIYLPGGVGKTAYGLTDTESGAKIRFVKETKHRPQIGIYHDVRAADRKLQQRVGRGKGLVQDAGVGAEKLGRVDDLRRRGIPDCAADAVSQFFLHRMVVATKYRQKVDAGRRGVLAPQGRLCDAADPGLDNAGPGRDVLLQKSRTATAVLPTDTRWWDRPRTMRILGFTRRGEARATRVVMDF